MKLIISVERNRKVRNSMTEKLIEYVNSPEVQEADSLEWARGKILAQIIYMRQRKMARGKVIIGAPYVSGRVIGTNRGRRAFGITQPGRRSWTISVRETEDNELPNEVQTA